MNGELNKNPIKETFLIGTRFPNRKSIAVCLDSVRTQEYFEIVSSLYKNENYEFDVAIFSGDNNNPVLVNPCALYYYNYFEYYYGNVIALTPRAAINAMQSGCNFESKIWHISDISGFKEISSAIGTLFNFYDHIFFINDSIRTIFFSFFPSCDKSKTSVAPLDIMAMEHSLK